MQPAANTSASAPEQTIQPKQKTGAFIGKIKNTATALVAGLGLVSSVEAQPNKSEAATVIATLSGNVITTLRSNEEQTATGEIQSTLVVPSSPNGGKVSLTFFYQADGLAASTTAGRTIDFDYKIQRTLAGGPTIDLVDYDGVAALNTAIDGSTYFDSHDYVTDTFDVGPEGGTFNYTLSQTAHSKYFASQNNIMGQQGNSTSTFDAVFTPNIPEPTIGLLGGLGTLLLLQRRRNNNK